MEKYGNWKEVVQYSGNTNIAEVSEDRTIFGDAEIISRRSGRRRLVGEDRSKWEIDVKRKISGKIKGVKSAGDRIN